MTFLGVEIIDTKQQPDLFVDIEPLEIPSDAILLDNSHCVVIKQEQQRQRTTHGMRLYEK